MVACMAVKSAIAAKDPWNDTVPKGLSGILCPREENACDASKSSSSEEMVKDERL